MSRHTVEAVVAQLRSQLATYRNEFALLADDMSTDTTQFTLQEGLPPGLRRGAIISIGAERMRVLSVEPGPRIVNVVRAWNSHVAPQEHSANADVWINSRFDVASMVDAMYDELTSWHMDLFRIDEALVAITGAQAMVALPDQFADALGVISVRRRWRGTVGTGEDTWPELDYRVVRGHALPGASASGIFVRPIGATTAGELHVVVGRPFRLEDWTLDTDLVAHVGLQPSMIDVLKLGVRYRLVGDDEAARSNRVAHNDSARGEQTPPGTAAQESMRLYAMYQRRKNTEVMQFRSRYPLRRA